MEFLPLCDVLFNVISLAGYFCDVVFDIVMGYALLERGYKGTFAAAMSIVVTSLVISQIISLRWYLHVYFADSTRKGRTPWLPILLHCLQCGVLWRYARLLVPVELRHVKHQVRDLCMLRLVHGFCSAAPMLLLQLHVMYRHSHRELKELGTTEPSVLEPPANKAFAELNVISASLSLFSVCWALASFSKNVRLQNVHRLVLTWLGVIFQFLWRLGTVSARICALTVYALAYEYWVFLVIGLHWLSMFLWLISPKNVFHGERISRPRKAYLSALIAFVYVFAYINLHEVNHRQKMLTFYLVMLLENMVLVAAWALASAAPRAGPALAVSAGFGAGLGFMLLYYRYFHVRRLGYMLGENQQGTNSTSASSQNKKGKQSNQTDNAAIPGVFNCRFTNPSGNARKKKKPTSFVPPPPAPRAAPLPAPAPAPAPAFWRRPLPTHNHHGGSSENEGSSVGSRVNIQQKLQEKKQKQLAELRVIEEEIKQGKLSKTTPVAEEIYSSIQRQPIPRAKTHADQPAWPSIEMTHPYQNYPIIPHNCNYPTYTEIKQDYTTQNENNQNGFQFYDVNTRANYDRFNYSEGNRMSNIYEDRQEYSYEGKEYGLGNRAGYECYGQNCGRFPYGKKDRKMQRCRTPEILLAPHYLERCCHWEAPYTTRKKEEKGGSSGEESPGEGGGGAPLHSDIDSQISLPRSYTLPREFRYWRRRPRLRDAHVASNNSSDGDVDSGDDSDRRSSWSCASQQHELAHEHAERRARRPAHKPQTRL